MMALMLTILGIHDGFDVDTYDGSDVDNIIGSDVDNILGVDYVHGPFDTDLMDMIWISCDVGK